MKWRWPLAGAVAAGLLVAVVGQPWARPVPLHSNVMPPALMPQASLAAVPPATADSSLAARVLPKVGERDLNAEVGADAQRAMKSLTVDISDSRDPMSCPAVARARACFEQWARLCELGALLELAAAASAASAAKR